MTYIKNFLCAGQVVRVWPACLQTVHRWPPPPAAVLPCFLLLSPCVLMRFTLGLPLVGTFFGILMFSGNMVCSTVFSCTELGMTTWKSLKQSTKVEFSHTSPHGLSIQWRNLVLSRHKAIMCLHATSHSSPNLHSHCSLSFSVWITCLILSVTMPFLLTTHPQGPTWTVR